MLPRSAFAPRHKNAGRPAEKRAPQFLQWLRGRRCLLHDKGECAGKMEAAHVDYAGKGTPDAKGMGTKAADRFNIPLSHNCHDLQHRWGWPWFDKHILGGAGAGEKMAGEYWRAWPGRIQYERQLEGSR